MALWRTARQSSATTWPFAVCSFTSGIVAVAAAGAAEFSLPVVCEPGKTCFIQNYADHDPGPAAQDYTCGADTYDGHKGTDFRVLSAAATVAGVAVVAARDGVVKGLRDGMDDYLLPDGEHARVTDRECGNGVVIDHGEGLETQYCHLKRRSVRVTKGQSVKRGDRLGDVGYSGLAEFAHVHFEVRKNGQVIDPFVGTGLTAACQSSAQSSGLWSGEAAQAFPRAGTEILGTFFADKVPSRTDLEVNHIVPEPQPGASALFFVTRIANIRKGDVVHIALNGPGGFTFDKVQEPLPMHRPLHLAFGSAQTRGGSPVPGGSYVGKVEIIRDGQVILARDAALNLE